ncbi:Helix-turn-helix domain [Shewanella psychrophila]|uniref:Helix-turn-helix domain n=1 Tax=Shewanella psychrophila TaxID=225848 RepID=A0A1S6HW15_9GAMM|nr:XRE family transcriptional regulator [Shewanella psychrophila]AQS39760.1 Helix-turn-helix domain [Shewanella psychrophila]
MGFLIDERHKKLIGERIKKARHSKGLTQSEAANLIGAKPNAWGMWEKGERSPRLYGEQGICGIAKGLCVTTSYLLGESDVENDGINNTGFLSGETIHTKSGSVVEQSSELISIHSSLLDNHGVQNFTFLSVVDDSMAPELCMNDTVLLDFKISSFHRVDIYAIFDEGSIWFRWIRKEVGGQYRLYANDRLHSSDQLLSKVELDNIQILGRVAWVGRWIKNR